MYIDIVRIVKNKVTFGYSNIAKYNVNDLQQNESLTEIRNRINNKTLPY